MSIDKSKIKAGDEVKVVLTYGGISWTSDWISVELRVYNSDLVIGNDVSLRNASIQIIDHKPGFKELEDAVESAKKALDDAEQALAEAKNPANLKYKYGALIYYCRGSNNTDRVFGTVIPCPDWAKAIDDETKVWANWDSGARGFGFMSLYRVKEAE